VFRFQLRTTTSFCDWPPQSCERTGRPCSGAISSPCPLWSRCRKCWMTWALRCQAPILARKTMLTFE